MAQINKYFRLARQIAVKGDTKEARRHFRLGAVGIRNDGIIVTSSNVPCREPERYAHAEARLARKLDYEAEVYVVRIDREGFLRNARPCRMCQGILRLKGVRQCFYSINEDEYGVLKVI